MQKRDPNEIIKELQSVGGFILLGVFAPQLQSVGDFPLCGGFAPQLQSVNLTGSGERACIYIYICMCI